jgi:hypothetical protein
VKCPLPTPLRFTCIAAYLIGPAGFRIWDDRFYRGTWGFFCMPPSVMFAAALARRSLWGLLWKRPVLLREDSLASWFTAAEPLSELARTRGLRLRSGLRKRVSQSRTLAMPMNP